MEHLIAKGVDRAVQFIHRRRMDAWKGEGEPFAIDGNCRRFSAVASLVAGRELEVTSLRGDTPPRPYWPVLHRMAHPALLPEHGFGWSDGETIFLPVSVVEMADEQAREDAARALLFFLAFQVKGGSLEVALRNRAMLSSDRLAADLYWIIENTRLCREILREYPGVLRNWASLASSLLDKRPAARYLNHSERKTEEFLRENIQATMTARFCAVPSLPKNAEESLGLAIGTKSRWAADGLKTGRYRAIVPFFPWGKLIPERIRTGEPGASCIRAAKNASRSTSGGRRQEEKPNRRARYAARREEVDEKANENGLTLNIYDKILSWAEFVNVRRPFDDDPDEDPGKKADECEELSISEIERTTASTFNAELEKTGDYSSADHEAVDPGEESFYYPEWDYKRRVYRADYSRLVEMPAVGEDAGFYARVLREKRGVIKAVTSRLEVISPSTRLIGRQAEGTAIDINAAVEAITDMEAGLTPDERLYSSQIRTERDLSALFLVDLSMSTDGWAGSARIIDHEKEALVVLCEALKKLRDRYAICGFSGKTRKGCRFYRVKGFGENYGEGVKKRIGGLMPHSYTRMGPAIRHATGMLASEKTRARLLFILSDGKPNDIDVYEGRYGIEDTRIAIKEAERVGVTPFCLTVDTGAGDYLPRLFGRGNYAVVQGVDMLARKLPELYLKIIRKL